MIVSTDSNWLIRRVPSFKRRFSLSKPWTRMPRGNGHSCNVSRGTVLVGTSVRERVVVLGKLFSAMPGWLETTPATEELPRALR